jgi:hypothetical protein
MGQTAVLGNGYIRSYVTTDSNGVPISIGIVMTEGALTGLPARNTEVNMPLPQPVPPYDHIAVDWNPHGHEPTQIYGVPHFDFHFYMVNQATLQQITATGADLERAMKNPPVQFIPPGYIATPPVPQMGTHWLPGSTPELHGQPFTQVFLYGFYNGEMIFIEPMITAAYLQAHPNYSTLVHD